MNLVIDANIFAAFFQETVLEIDVELSESPSFIFERLGNEDVAFVDDGDQIISEWKNLVEPEWFDSIYPELLQNGCIIGVSTETCHTKIKSIKSKFGFPNSRDIWLLRVAFKISKEKDIAILISEDLDFFDPKKKKCDAKTRSSILENCTGKLCNHLSKKESIYIKSVFGYKKEIKA